MKILSSPWVHLKRIHPGARALVVTGALLITAGIWAPVPAGATFTGATPGNVAFIAICNGEHRTTVYSLNPVGVPPPTYTCPGGTSPEYTQSTAGSATPCRTSRLGVRRSTSPATASRGTTREPMATSPSTKWRTRPTVSGSPGSQTDGATQITFPGSQQRLRADRLGQRKRVGVHPLQRGHDVLCALHPEPDRRRHADARHDLRPAPAAKPISGEASRPEIDPAEQQPDPLRGYGQPHPPRSARRRFRRRDLSRRVRHRRRPGRRVPGLEPAGTSIIFDRSHNIYVFYGIDPTLGTATACELWAATREPRLSRLSPRPTRDGLPRYPCNPRELVRVDKARWRETTSSWTWGTGSAAR